MSPMLFARAISKGEPIKVFNNGDMIRDFTYIDDIAEGTIHTLDHVPDAAKCPKQRALQSIQHRLLGADAARRRLPDERRHHET